MINCVANQPFFQFADTYASYQVSVNMVTPEIHNTARPVAQLFKLQMHSPQSRTGKIYAVRSFFGHIIFSGSPFSCLEPCIGGGLKKHLEFLELDGTTPLVG